MFLDVILRSPASGGTTKNLEILRYTQDDIVSFFAEFILSLSKGSE
jgi:hypothetical protein